MNSNSWNNATRECMIGHAPGMVEYRAEQLNMLAFKLREHNRSVYGKMTLVEVRDSIINDMVEVLFSRGSVLTEPGRQCIDSQTAGYAIFIRNTVHHRVVTAEFFIAPDILFLEEELWVERQMNPVQ